METLSYSGRLVIEKCWCGIPHAVPFELRQHQLDQFNDGLKPVGIYCPLGHSWIPSGKRQVDIERERLNRAEARETHLRDQLETAERSKAALKGQVTKIKKRASKGVCPCCNRSFENVTRHMSSQHPDYVEAHK